MQRSQLEHLIRAAGEKDAVLNRALLDHGVVRLEAALVRAAELPDATEAARAAAWMRRLASSAPP